MGSARADVPTICREPAASMKSLLHPAWVGISWRPDCVLGRTVTTASIWVDADACPNVIKELLFRAAERTGIAVTLVANRPLTIPRVPNLRLLQVSDGFDVADKQIVERSMAGD